MFIIDLVRSATDKAAPSFEHPYRVVGGVVVGIGLVGCLVLWAVLPGSILERLIGTLLIASALLFLPDFIIKIKVVIREKRKNKELTTVNQQEEIKEVTVMPQNVSSEEDDGLPDFEKTGPPKDYRSPRHWRSAVYQIVPFLIPCVILLALVTWRVGFEHGSFYWLFVLALIIPLVLLSIRSYWIWKHWIYVCSANNGNLKKLQPEKLILFIKGSSPDTVSLNNVNIDTDKSWAEALFFKRSQTLVIQGTSQEGDDNDRKLRFVVNAEHIVLIHDYREYLERASAQNTEETVKLLAVLVEEQSENNELQRRTNELLGDLISTLKELSLAPKPAWENETAPLPALPSLHDE